MSTSCEISPKQCHRTPLMINQHYLVQSWPRCMMPYGITRPQNHVGIYLHLYHFPALRWCRCVNSFLIGDNDPFILHIQYQEPGPRLNMFFPGMGIPMLKIRRSWDRLIFNMGIPKLVRRHLYIEMAPRASAAIVLTQLSWNIHQNG